MAIWFWVLVFILFLLFFYQIYAWFRDRALPETDAAPVEDQHAPLARANMKIAHLESRLQESTVNFEKETATLRKQWQQRLAQVEAAYQEQMVSLHERVNRDTGGASAEAADIAPGDEYEVRLAGEVDAWLVAQGNDEAAGEYTADAPADPEVSEMETSRAEVSHAQEEDVVGTSEAQAVVSVEASVPELVTDDLANEIEPVEAWEDDEAVDAVSDLSQEARLKLEESIILESTPTHAVSDRVDGEIKFHNEEDSLLLSKRIQLLDAGDEAPQDEGANFEAGGAIGGVEYVKLSIKTEQQDTDAPFLGYDRSDSDKTAEADDDPAQDVGEPDETVAVDGQALTTESDLANTPLQEELIEQQVRALQRAQARRLGSEMDADYLEYDEFIREMGFEQAAIEFSAALAGNQLEVGMSSDDWMVDPLDVLAKHIAGLNISEDEAPDAESKENGAGNLREGDSLINVWEAMVYESASEAREKGAAEQNGSADSVNVNGVSGSGWPDMSDETPAQTVGEKLAARSRETDRDLPSAEEIPDEDFDSEEALAIAAAVDEILSRAPQGHDQQFSPSPDVESEPEAASILAESVEAAADSAPETAVVLDGADAAPVTAAASDTGEAIGVVPSSLVLELPAAFAGTMEDEDEINLETGEELQAAAADETDEAGIEYEAPRVSRTAANGTKSQTPWVRKPITWQAEYFANTSLADEPIVVRQDRDIDFDWLDRSPAQGVDPRTFSVRWRGNMNLEPGRYSFEATAPDGVRLWLNDRLVISAWYDQSEQTYRREFAWHGGPVDVRVEHYENGGDARARLTWNRV